VRQAGRPPIALLANAQSVTGAVATLDEVAGCDTPRQLDERPAVRAADTRHDQSPSSRCKRPRSKPTITSSPTVMTGTAMRPVFAISASRASVSSATFLAVNSMP
jgi:hypothetical protein